jgi:hypothetical protein
MAVSGRLHASGEKDFQFAFDRPGRYRITAQYWSGQGRERALHFSNEVSIWVSEPRGRDGDLFRDVLRPRPELLTEWAFDHGFAGDSDIEEIGRLLREHEGSRYLARIRHLYWQRRLQDAFLQRGLGGRPLTDQDRALLDEAEAEPTTSDPFYADRLLTAAEMRMAWRDHEGAARSYRKLLSESPDSETAAKARSWLAAHDREHVLVPFLIR